VHAGQIIVGAVGHGVEKEKRPRSDLSSIRARLLSEASHIDRWEAHGKIAAGKGGTGKLDGH
jgi:hypothetical protein